MGRKRTVVLTWVILLAGCKGGELPVTQAPPVRVEVPAAGALVSAGTHDVVVLLHHTREYDFAGVRRQVDALEVVGVVLEGQRDAFELNHALLLEEGDHLAQL